MTSDEETWNIKIVDLKKIWNFVVLNFFILIHLGSQIIILIPDQYRITRSSIEIRHKLVCSVVDNGWIMKGWRCGFESHRLCSVQIMREKNKNPRIKYFVIF